LRTLGLRTLGYTAALVLERTISRGAGRARGRFLARLLAAFGVLAAAAFVAGCGGGGSSTSSGDGSLPPSVVTDSDISAQASGSPSQALLEWWQAYQYSDAQQVVERTAKDTLNEVGEKNLSDLVQAQGGSLQGVEVLGEEVNGNTASVRVGLLQFTPSKPGGEPPSEPTASTPNTFEMKKEGGDWKFDSPFYLEPKIEAFKQAQQQQTSTSTNTTTGKSTTTTTTTGGG
jgi:hypothetical protein